MTLSLQPNQTIHFVGIGGSGMGPLAELLAGRGISVQGSDKVSSYVTEHLTQLGVKVFANHIASNIDNASSVVVSSAVQAENPEVAAAKAKGIPVYHRSDVLAAIMNPQRGICVSGTHGKTTTTALIAHMLTSMNCDPTVVVGGKMLNSGSSMRLGKSDLVVAEADESDGTFLKYKPFINVVTNIDSDHWDYYRDEEHLHATFEQSLNSTHEDGCAIVGWDDAGAREVGSRYKGTRLTYGSVIGCDIRLISYENWGGIARFSAVVERDLIKCHLPMPGKHNAINALAALGVARSLELNIRVAAEALANFQGVARRLQIVGDFNGTRIIDDYAHNPGKIAASVAAVRESWPDHKLYVVFQPHRFSRLRSMFDAMSSAFTNADEVIVLPVYSAGEPDTGEYSVEKIATHIQALSHTKTSAQGSFESAIKYLHNELNSHKTSSSEKGGQAIVMTVGAGDVSKIAEKMKVVLGNESKKERSR